ncbi:MAG: diacylglycerol kinase family lipid kinase [Elusimicrobia bacterium]|nr:diacylglycerol kinase family lipid kinase [Elusimicrobiota bacterium]
MSYFFIINPCAGKDSAAQVPELIHDFFKGRRLRYELAFTERRGHAGELSRRAVINGFSHIVAAGGDGTICEAAESLIGKTQALGILPIGSGNGLARNLYIPLKIEEALNGVLQWRPRKIDAGLANGKPFFCAAGVGLDAEVARIFNNRTGGRRGILPYVYHCAVTFLTYRPRAVVIAMNGHRYEFSPMVTAVLNGRQYGGGATIAPDAYIDDGILSVVVVKKAGILRTLRAVPDLFNGKLPRNKDLVANFTARTIELTCPAGSPYHLDGEDFESDGNLKFSVLRQVLNVHAP